MAQQFKLVTGSDPAEVQRALNEWAAGKDGEAVPHIKRTQLAMGTDHGVHLSGFDEPQTVLMYGVLVTYEVSKP